MSWGRRSVLATGAALSIGGLASIGTGSEDDDAAELPDPDVDPNPGMANDDWASFAGDAGHARFIEDGYEFNGDLEVAWTVADGELASSIGSPSVAVADGTVYVTSSTAYTDEQVSFGVAAYDAGDGSMRWKNGDINASDPTVVGDTVYVAGAELFAIDVSDGSVRWQTEFDPEEPIETQTVAYGAVFVVVDGTLYALETDDGSVRWELESITVESNHADNDEETVGFLDTTAAANGVVYAAAGDRSATNGAALALEPETGAEVWRYEEQFTQSAQTRATTAAVALGRISFAERIIRHAQTGENLGIEVAEYGDTTFGEEIRIGIGAQYMTVNSITGDDYSWEIPIRYTAGQPIISGETIYTYLEDDTDGMSSWPEYRDELVAFDKYDGTEKWTISEDDLPVGVTCAISDNTIYVDHEGDLVALREQTDDEEGDDRPDEGDEDDGTDDTDGGDDERDGSEEGDNDDDEDECCPDDGPADEGGSGDDGGSAGDDGDAGNGNAGNEDTGDETDAENGTETDAGNESETTTGTETDDGDDTDADDVPGFTTGGGLLGGAAALEWLRRKAGVDESTSVTEPSE